MNLLPAYLHAERLYSFLKAHPELQEVYPLFYGCELEDSIYAICDDVKKGRDPEDITSAIATLEARSKRLAATNAKWN
jgi:hypothetical protein